MGKVKPGGLGRDMEGLEGVRVTLENERGKGSGNGRAARLGELAQVVPRGGKSVNVLVGEKEVSLRFWKPKTTAKAKPLSTHPARQTHPLRPRPPSPRPNRPPLPH